MKGESLDLSMVWYVMLCYAVLCYATKKQIEFDSYINSHQKRKRDKKAKRNKKEKRAGA